MFYAYYNSESLTVETHRVLIHLIHENFFFLSDLVTLRCLPVAFRSGRILSILGSRGRAAPIIKSFLEQAPQKK